MGGDARPTDVTTQPRNGNESAHVLRARGGLCVGLRRLGTDRAPRVTRRGLASAVVSTDLRQHLGRIGEDLALAHLERLGFKLVARNHRTRYGELDLVVFDGTTLVFAEVKTRRANRAGRGPWEALHERKRKQVRRMAAAFLIEPGDRPRSADLRFDAVGVIIDGQGRLVRLDHLEAAF
jgi:putative endonuclease